MNAVEPVRNTIYLVWLAPDDARHVRDDFREYPFPDWELEVLESGAEIPFNLLAGRAVLVVGCRTGKRPGYSEAMWLVRLLACGCPWIAVADATAGPPRPICEAAGAVAHVARPFVSSNLRDLIWQHAVPLAGTAPISALTCERLLRYLAILGVDVLLKFTSDAGHTGYLAMRAGVPTNATILDGATGPDALREILRWGKGRALGQPITPDVPHNLDPVPHEWEEMLSAEARATLYDEVPGGREVCEAVLRELQNVTACVLVNVRSGRIGAEGAAAGGAGANEAIVALAVGVMRAELLTIQATGYETTEQPSEFVALGPDGWWSATRFGATPYALLVVVEGHSQLDLARMAIATAAAEFIVPADGADEKTFVEQ